MPTKTKSARRAPPPVKAAEPPDDLGPSPLCSPEQRRQLLKALGERVDGHIRFMCKVDTLPGVSAEAKERALSLFHERLALLEKELARIGENLQLE
jgi:hypothetical protein